jgi:hypothetical protein
MRSCILLLECNIGGFRMWEMTDTDGRDQFYKPVFSVTGMKKEVRYYKRTAKCSSTRCEEFAEELRNDPGALGKFRSLWRMIERCFNLFVELSGARSLGAC